MLASLPDDQLSTRKMATLDELLADLTAKRAELVDTLKQIDAAIKHVRDAREAIGGNLADLFSQPETPERAQPARTQGVLSPAEVAKHARSALLAHGRPMKRGALARLLLERGVPLAGADLNKNLGTILWRHPDMFVRIDGMGYWPKDVPIEGVYSPDE